MARSVRKSSASDSVVSINNAVTQGIAGYDELTAAQKQQLIDMCRAQPSHIP